MTTTRSRAWWAALAWVAAGCGEPPRDTTDPTTPPAWTFDQIPARGAFAGTDAGVDARRAAFDLVDPPELNNPNDLAAAPGSEDIAPLDSLQQQVLPSLNLTVTASPAYRFPWSSTAGILASADFVQTDYFSNWPFPEGRTECIAPDLMIDCCTYTLTEGEDGSGLAVDYYKPADLFVSEASADVALREIYAQIPVFLPYTDSEVKLGHGWIYNGGERDPHGSMDYSRSGTEEGEDPSFRVRAASWGTVVAKYWDDWHGNVVVLEHENSGDFEYRSFYFHLRNGKTNDLAQAKANTVATGDAESSRDKYLKFAKLANPNSLWWGTDAHAIPVEVGDTVSAHEQIAWSGNTGPGGAGAGLDTSGNPTNDITANNHLHYMLAVRHPTWTGGEWMYVDPQSVYDQQSSGCYDILENTRFDRMTAPFYPYFHGVDLGVFNAYLYYYGQMGRSPATFSVQQPGDGATIAGAFKGGLGTSWYVYDYLTAPDWDTYWQDTVDAGFQLEQRAVTLDSSDVPRHSGVFRPDAGDGWSSYSQLDLTTYQETFDDLTALGSDLTDFFGYHDGNEDRVAAIFTPQAGDFIHQGLLDSATFTTLTNDYAEDGWLPVDVNVMEMADGTYLSAIYRQTGDGRMVHWGMSPDEYQQWMDFYLIEGWDLEVVQSYADGSLYAAIWSI